MQPVITVGLNGSPESLAAARWAADEADKRKLTLRLLHAWPLLSPEPARGPSEVDQNYWAKRFVHTARAELETLHPGLPVIGSLVADDARKALLHAPSESELIVLGSRGLDAVESYFLGDVSMPVVARAQRPVVLIRAETPSYSSDGTSAAETSRAARSRGVPLHARVPWGVDHAVAEEVTRDAQQELSRILSRWREKYPQVDAACVIRLENPSKAIVQAAHDAALLVVGRRAHRHGVAPHLGPVAHAAIHHGHCPVAVVPHD
ncbi:universal stress protein [Streptomyces bobili]|uniref:universal stress protein n=1 Tax=Streptomyces bobili TaxID=67280 RepID=UPI0034265B5F